MKFFYTYFDEQCYVHWNDFSYLLSLFFHLDPLFSMF